MKLEQLMEDVPFTLVQGTLETEIEDIIYDSRKAAPGLLFVCIVGTQRDSHDLAADCVAKGVNTLVIQHDIDLSAMPDVNVIKVERSAHGDVHLVGYNSDVVGFCDSLRPLLKPQHRKALVLGTGGAARAVRHGLMDLGLEATMVSRVSRPDDYTVTYGDLTPEVMAENLVIVNTTPLGMYPHTDECPDIPYDMLTPSHLCYDLIYNPEETLFMRRSA